jgi:hypothetical protein
MTWALGHWLSRKFKYSETNEKICHLFHTGFELFSHGITVLVPQMAVCFCDKNAAVSMALPRRNGFEINPQFNGSRDEASSERSRAESRKSETLTRCRQSFLRAFNAEHILALFDISIFLQTL